MGAAVGVSAAGIGRQMTSSIDYLALAATSTVKIELGLGYLLILPLWIFVIAVIAGRVLGLRVGRLRSTVAAIVGWFFGLIAGAVALGPGNAHALLVVPVTIFFGVLVALPVAIIIDLVTRGRERPRPGRSPLRH